MKRAGYWLHVHASSEQLSTVHDAVRPRGYCSGGVELGIILPKLKFAPGLEDIFDHFQHLGGRDIAWVRDIVDAKGDFLKPAIKAGFHIVRTVGEGVEVVVDLGVALDLGEVIAVVIEFVERNPQPPDVVLAHPFDGLLSQSLGSAVEAAGLIPEGKVWSHRLIKAADLFRIARGDRLELGLGHILLDHPAISVIDPRPRKDAARGHMTKGDIECSACVCQSLWEKRVALEGISLGRLTGINIRLAGVASRIDDEAGPVGLEVFVERLKARVIYLRARERHKALTTAGEFRLKSLANVACGTEEEEHVRKKS